MDISELQVLFIERDVINDKIFEETTRQFPVGARVRVKWGRGSMNGVVYDHCAGSWSGYVYIIPNNSKSGKARLFPCTAILEIES